jgi:hypothetical protein
LVDGFDNFVTFGQRRKNNGMLVMLFDSDDIPGFE